MSYLYIYLCLCTFVCYYVSVCNFLSLCVWHLCVGMFAYVWIWTEASGLVIACDTLLKIMHVVYIYIYIYIYIYVYIYMCACNYTFACVRMNRGVWFCECVWNALKNLYACRIYIYVCVRAHLCVCIFWCVCVCTWIEASCFVSAYGTLSKMLQVYRIYTYICVCEFICLCWCIGLEASGPVQPIADVVAQNLEIFSKRCQYTTSLPTGFTTSTRS